MTREQKQGLIIAGILYLLWRWQDSSSVTFPGSEVWQQCPDGSVIPYGQTCANPAGYAGGALSFVIPADQQFNPPTTMDYPANFFNPNVPIGDGGPVNEDALSQLLDN